MKFLGLKEVEAPTGNVSMSFTAVVAKRLVTVGTRSAAWSGFVQSTSRSGVSVAAKSASTP